MADDEQRRTRRLAQEAQFSRQSKMNTWSAQKRGPEKTQHSQMVQWIKEVGTLSGRRRRPLQLSSSGRGLRQAATVLSRTKGTPMCCSLRTGELICKWAIADRDRVKVRHWDWSERCPQKLLCRDGPRRREWGTSLATAKTLCSSASKDHQRQSLSLPYTSH